MTQTNTHEETAPFLGFMRPHHVQALAILLVLACVAFLSFYQVSPPAAVDSNAALTEFSSARAMKKLEVIAQKPHPVGMPEHRAVRDYIIGELTAMGLNPQVQNGKAVRGGGGYAFVGADVENIFVSLQGTSNSKAVMLVGHYDSVPTGPGAADDGSACAMMIETLRAVQAGPPLKNDVRFLFTDAEEVGLLGAQAYADNNPLAKDVGVVLNFEARGTGGAALMFETSADNGWLISQLAVAAPHPVANSLTYEIYKLLPNDTDLTVFKKAGLAGLNFDFIKDINHYHTQLDNLEQLDERSLQHQGSYALSLARHFGNLDLEQVRQSNAVYFNIPGSILIHYPSSWIMPILLLVVLLFAAVIFIGFRRKQLSLSGIVLGFFGLLLSIIASAVITALALWLINLIKSGSNSIGLPEPYGSKLYFAGFAALSLAITSFVYTQLAKRRDMRSLSVGALLWWLILTVLSSLLLPGGSYLFTWPLVFSLLAILFILFSDRERAYSTTSLAVLLICAVPGIILMLPTIYVTFLALTLRLSAGLVVLIVLLLGLLIPHISLVSGPSRWLAAASLLAALGFIVGGFVTSGYDANHRRANTVFYAMNADLGKAVWASFDQKPDEWTSQFFDGQPQKGPLNDYIVSSYDRFMQSEAPKASLSAPEIVLLGSSTAADGRTLRLRVKSNRQAPVIILSVDPAIEVSAFELDSKQITNKGGGRWGLYYYGLPGQGLEISLEVKSTGSVTIRATDISYGLPALPEVPIRTRPNNMMPSMLPYSDTTLITKSFVF